MPALSASEMIRQRQSRLNSAAAAGGQSAGRQRQQPSDAGSTKDLTADARRSSDAVVQGSHPNEQDGRAMLSGEDEPPSQPTQANPVSAKEDARTDPSEETETEKQVHSHDPPTLHDEGECGDTGDSSLPLLTTGPSPLPTTKSQSGHSVSSRLALPTNSIRSSLDRHDTLTAQSRTADESGSANFTDRLVGRRHDTSLQRDDDGLVTSAMSVSSGTSPAWRSSRASCDDDTEIAGHTADGAASKTLAVPAGGGINGEDEHDEPGDAGTQESAIDIDGVGSQGVIDDSQPDEADVEAPNIEAGQDVEAKAAATKTSLVVIDGVTVKVNDDAPLASIGRSHDDSQDSKEESKRALPWYKRPFARSFIILVAGAAIAAGLLVTRPWESTPRADGVDQSSENETVNNPSDAQDETTAMEPEVTSPELVFYSTAPSISAIPTARSMNRPTASPEQVRLQSMLLTSYKYTLHILTFFPAGERAH